MIIISHGHIHVYGIHIQFCMLKVANILKSIYSEHCMYKIIVCSSQSLVESRRRRHHIHPKILEIVKILETPVGILTLRQVMYVCLLHSKS